MPELKLPLEIEDIKKCIPHRYPFLLVDRVLALKPGEYIEATKAISIGDQILQGHFPDNPVYPGVLMVESMAQASAVLGKFTSQDETSSCLLTEISSTRFRRQIVPGDLMHIKIQVVKSRAPFYWFDGEVRVGDQVAATAKLSAKLF